MPRVYLGLGSNVGDKAAMIDEALRRLGATPGIRVAARSRPYRTPPWGETDQPWFVNAAAVVVTTLSPHALLEAGLAVELGLGRVRELRWGPRTIDVDLLAYEGAVVRDEALTLPHPYLLERAFVLAPLAEIAPDLVVDGVRIADALARLDRTGITPLNEGS